MSKQANEKLHTRLVEISTSYGSYIMLDKTLWPKMFEAIEKYVSRNYTPNSVIEQRCLEARIEKLERLKLLDDEAINSAVILPLLTTSGRGIIASWIAESKSQLTNLQNKEKK